MGSQTFTFNTALLEKVVNSVKDKFQLFSESQDDKQNIISRLVLSSNQNQLNLIFYGTGKCLLQGRDGEFFENVKNHLSSIDEVSSIEKKENISPQLVDEIEIYNERNFIIGFDEAGKGEALGDMVLASVCLPKEKLHLFQNLKTDVKSMSLKELSYYCNLLKTHRIRFEYEIVSAMEITNSPFIINRLMDLKYISLIRKYSGILSKNHILAIDDYYIMDDLSNHLEKLKQNGVEFICDKKIDERITATRLASVVARHIRLTSINDLEQQNQLNYNNEIFSFGKGANNDQMTNWLTTYRILHPNFEFPDFVRKNWKNVKSVELQYHKQKVELSISCPHCVSKISKLQAYYNPTQKKLLYLCSHCNKMIDKNILKENHFHFLLCDSSALVAGLVSKDLNSNTPIFRNSKVILLYKILDEIDTLALSKKRGALNELQRIREFEQVGKIKTEKKDYEITSPFDADNKLYGSIAKDNSLILVSGDHNVADCSHVTGAFVIKIINYLPQQKQIDNF